jgi:hypothetical protein
MSSTAHQKHKKRGLAYANPRFFISSLSAKYLLKMLLRHGLFKEVNVKLFAQLYVSFREGFTVR